MLGVFAELDRKTIVLKLQAQHVSVRRRRQDVAKVAVSLMDTGKVSHRLFERMKDMHASGATWEAIAKTLNAEGIKTRHNGIWYPATIRRMILKQAAQAASTFAPGKYFSSKTG